MRLLIDYYKITFDFKGECRLRDYLLTILFLMILASLFGFLATENPSLVYLPIIYLGISALPFLSLMVRRLNDSGKSWKTLLWIILPIFGWIIIFVALITRSQTQKERPVSLKIR